MTYPERIAAAFAGVVSSTGQLAPLILFAATFVEHVFPPFPGDLLVVLGAWYAVQGQLSWAAAFASVTAGAVAGAWVDYRIGAALGRRVESRLSGRNPRLEARLARFEASYRRWGSWLLVMNRFFPGVRAFLFLAAGASGIPLRRVLVLGGVSAALWNALLLALGALVASNVEELVQLLGRYTALAWAVLAGAVVVALAVALWRRRPSRGPPRPDPESSPADPESSPSPADPESSPPSSPPTGSTSHDPIGSRPATVRETRDPDPRP